MAARKDLLKKRADEYSDIRSIAKVETAVRDLQSTLTSMRSNFVSRYRKFSGADTGKTEKVRVKGLKGEYFVKSATFSTSDTIIYYLLDNKGYSVKHAGKFSFEEKELTRISKKKKS